jgi:hypothetical protein
MLNQIRSKASVSAAIVVAGTLSNRSVTENRARRIGQTERRDAMQIIIPSSSENNRIENNNNNNESNNEMMTMNSFMNNKFSGMVEELAQNQAVQDIVFKQLPLTKKEQQKIKQQQQLQLAVIESSESDNDVAGGGGGGGGGGDTGDVNDPRDETIRSLKADIEYLEEELEYQDEKYSYMTYFCEDLNDQIDMLWLAFESHGIETNEMKAKHEEIIKQKNIKRMAQQSSRNHTRYRNRNSNETQSTTAAEQSQQQQQQVEEVEEEQEEVEHNNEPSMMSSLFSDEGDDVSINSMLRAAVITAAVYVVALCFMRRRSGNTKICNEFAQSAKVTIESSVRNAFKYGTN